MRVLMVMLILDAMAGVWHDGQAASAVVLA